MTVAELLTFLIHQDQSKEVLVFDEYNRDWDTQIHLKRAFKNDNGDVLLECEM